MMKLLKFRVTNFRSVEDSGWIDTDNVTALIGTNESGKTNLLVPLWKLHPAKDGEINPLADYPRKRYNDIRAMEKKPIFIDAYFELSDELASQIAELTSASVDEVRITRVKRDFGKTYWIDFPNASPTRSIAKDEIIQLLAGTHSEISQLAVDTTESELKKKCLVLSIPFRST
jgi:energy-coupling factor transporter ATP-binding protein EcfA2